MKKKLSGNEKFKQKTKDNKQFRFDMTKEGKLDVSFLRVDKKNRSPNLRKNNTKGVMDHHMVLAFQDILLPRL